MNVIHIIIGLAATCFIPGFLLVKIVLPKQKLVELLWFSIAGSIIITVLTGIVLGYNQAIAEMTGGISLKTTWLAQLSVITVLGLIYIGKEAWKYAQEYRKVVQK